MSTFVKIKALKPSLSQSEAKLADFTLKSGSKIRGLSSIELAKSAGVSQSSVVKFAQKLGYKGFPAFKLAVVDALNEQTQENTPLSNEIDQNDSIAHISEKLIANQQATLVATSKLNNPELFEQAVQAIKGAKKVMVCAIGSTHTMAQDLTLKLQKLGVCAVTHVDELSAASYVATMGKDDLLICLSNSGVVKSMVKLAQQAKVNECQILALTRYGHSELANYADNCLYCIQETEAVKHSAVLTRASLGYLIDVLFIALAQSNLHWQRRADRSNEYMSDMLNI
ncbi:MULTISPECIES: MurR/RpiR family transcriptional regulator [Pseudoalteromonas]|uniref:Transcriptional regulator n=2 Tax=Pseudoalteromonas TaxID=53246 RepID=V4H6H0_PSEL2|nr:MULTISPECIES: MurR/RpiR family transcriptional regulator [Pseudoalteromonas]ESP93091.1 transcriptional regulator [Pseudoalteromonas luteoviolacea 2ta16]KZN31574.1 hypothetical protein N483_27140 [Pseudoalteromonas luteoviolacea NCIMB 1944]MBQ4840088.1 MurR/RpiR family transcriptional regulator [Pseudoalteromonas luteoviolacea]MCG7551679.1 MurR/RpiR family transcriptional regulator [Pseudoalteromonas sp. Of7M-16]MDK2596450.1 MurR/RpiR family transcriptional regulator [Pseudoalteromonas sp. P